MTTKSKVLAIGTSLLAAAGVTVWQLSDLSTGSKPVVITWSTSAALTGTEGQIAFSSMVITETNVELKWTGGVPGRPMTLSSGPDADGPWSAITNTTYQSVIIPRFNTNGFYQLSQSNLKLERYWVGGQPGEEPEERIGGQWVFSFVGNNDIAFIIYDLQWWESSFDYLVTITNGVMPTFPLTAPGMPSCAPLESAIDDVNWRYYTLETGCFYGPTGPWTFREWQLTGANGYFTNAAQLSAEVMGGDFGSSMGDMIRLQSGGFVVCWKSPSSNYCFRYRSPEGVWQPIWCETQTLQAPSTMELGQHPDGTVYCLITKDGDHWMPLLVFFEAEGQLNYQTTIYGKIQQEGEWSKVAMVPDFCNNRLFASRAAEPYYAFQWGEGILTIKGGAFQSALIYSPVSILESKRRPVETEDWGHIPGTTNFIHIKNVNWPLNTTEVVAGNAVTIANEQLWAVFQEYNPNVGNYGFPGGPNIGNFSLVYAQPWDDFNGWGDRLFLYQAPASYNFRGYGMNWLTSYRNSSQTPSRLMFANCNEEGELEVFELVPFK